MTSSGEPTATGALDRRTTSDSVVEALRTDILSGVFADGEELNQVALARHFGVSRVPIREALRQLQAEGLVDAQPHMRAVVRGLTLERVLEVLDVRLLVESYLLGRAATNLSSRDLDRLERLCDVMAEAPDRATWLAENRRFHESLYEPSGAVYATELARQLQARIQRYIQMRSTAGVERDDEANAEHRRIVEALAQGDVHRARLELELHIAHTRDRVVQIFDARSREDSAAVAAGGVTA